VSPVKRKVVKEGEAMWMKIDVLCACGSMLFLLCSCGCRGSADPSADVTITRANDGKFSMDAKALAARIAAGSRILANKAAMFDNDLTRIRKQYPQVADIHTPGDYKPNDILIGVSLKAPGAPSGKKEC
jgi:hypothetical protein